MIPLSQIIQWRQTAPWTDDMQVEQDLILSRAIVEIFSILDRLSKPFTVKSDWFNQNVEVNTFQLEELLATKLRALYERKKGRDAFDLWLAIKEKDFDPNSYIGLVII